MLPLLLAVSIAQATEWTPESKKVVYVTKTQAMSATPEQCLAVATDFDGWKNWTAWTAERDPEAEWTYTNVDGMVGDEMTWNGPELDSGRTVITGYTAASEGAAGVMDFTTYFGKKQTPSMGRITCAPGADGGTQATWEFQMKAGLMTRMFRGSIEKAIGGDFVVGLAGLTEVAESLKAPEPAPVVVPPADEAMPEPTPEEPVVEEPAVEEPAVEEPAPVQ
jgi:hypothetical protein